MTRGKFFIVSTRLMAESIELAITPAALLNACANRLPMKLPLIAVASDFCVLAPSEPIAFS